MRTRKSDPFEETSKRLPNWIVNMAKLGNSADSTQHNCTDALSIRAGVSPGVQTVHLRGVILVRKQALDGHVKALDFRTASNCDFVGRDSARRPASAQK
jgi:hypothetical protein